MINRDLILMRLRMRKEKPEFGIGYCISGQKPVFILAGNFEYNILYRKYIDHQNKI